MLMYKTFCRGIKPVASFIAGAGTAAVAEYNRLKYEERKSIMKKER
jgi:hypothetical protein